MFLGRALYHPPIAYRISSFSEDRILFNRYVSGPFAGIEESGKPLLNTQMSGDNENSGSFLR